MVSELSKKLQKKNVNKDVSIIIAEQIADTVETLDSKKSDSDGYKKIKTLMFFSDLEYNEIVNGVTDKIKAAAEKVKSSSIAVNDLSANIENIKNKSEKEQADKKLESLKKQFETDQKTLKEAVGGTTIRKAIKSAKLMDAADIALFGRMVAKDHTLNVEAASMFSHALSTHKVDNEIDFFAAVDDLQTKEESGAGITSTLEFNSATYYRFAALNLDMLTDEDHLKGLSLDQRKSVVRTFVHAVIKAVPGARKNTMNGNTIPDYVLGVIREKGHPIQLVNAFERPVRSTQGHAVESIKRLKYEYVDLKDTWGIEGIAMATAKKSLKDQIHIKSDKDVSGNSTDSAFEVVSLKDLIEGMVKHVI
jgi:CRISPR system Cascade subunit CasC